MILRFESINPFVYRALTQEEILNLPQDTRVSLRKAQFIATRIMEDRDKWK